MDSQNLQYPKAKFILDMLSVVGQHEKELFLSGHYIEMLNILFNNTPDKNKRKIVCDIAAVTLFEVKKGIVKEGWIPSCYDLQTLAVRYAELGERETSVLIAEEYFSFLIAESDDNLLYEIERQSDVLKYFPAHFLLPKFETLLDRIEQKPLACVKKQMRVRTVLTRSIKILGKPEKYEEFYNECASSLNSPLEKKDINRTSAYCQTLFKMDRGDLAWKLFFRFLKLLTPGNQSFLKGLPGLFYKKSIMKKMPFAHLLLSFLTQV